MRSFAATILILLLSAQVFSHWMMIGAFKLNQAGIAKNICENRFRPQLNCNGKCVLMKKLKQKEKQEQKDPLSLKLETPAQVLSSRNFFTLLVPFPEDTRVSYHLPHDSGNPVDLSFSFFHPPNQG